VAALLPALVGLNKAREMLFLGERYDAATLAETGSLGGF
jgi:enoyl-CoA hydratase/carnithine racemase